MNKAISLALLIGGIILIIFGLNESDSIGSSFTRFFTGNPTDKSMWFLLGGVIAAVLGTVGLGRGSKTS